MRQKEKHKNKCNRVTMTIVFSTAPVFVYYAVTNLSLFTPIFHHDGSVSFHEDPCLLLFNPAESFKMLTVKFRVTRPWRRSQNVRKEEMWNHLSQSHPDTSSGNPEQMIFRISHGNTNRSLLPSLRCHFKAKQVSVMVVNLPAPYLPLPICC